MNKVALCNMYFLFTQLFKTSETLTTIDASNMLLYSWTRKKNFCQLIDSSHVISVMAPESQCDFLFIESWSVCNALVSYFFKAFLHPDCYRVHEILKLEERNSSSSSVLSRSSIFNIDSGCHQFCSLSKVSLSSFICVLDKTLCTIAQI